MLVSLTPSQAKHQSLSNSYDVCILVIQQARQQTLLNPCLSGLRLEIQNGTDARERSNSIQWPRQGGGYSRPSCTPDQQVLIKRLN